MSSFSAASPASASSSPSSPSLSLSAAALPSVVFVTGNAKKLAETRAILADVIPDLQSLDIDGPHPQLHSPPHPPLPPRTISPTPLFPTPISPLSPRSLSSPPHPLPSPPRLSCAVPELQGPSSLSVTRAKAIHARTLAPCPILVEDTSLCFNALHSLPGPYIKWFLASLGHAGLVRLLAGHTDKSAYAQCVFAYVAEVGDEPLLFDGRCPGTVVDARLKEGATEAFGWDPIFQPDEGGGLTYAEMDGEAKHRISHRGRALAQVKVFFAQHPEVLRRGGARGDGGAAQHR